MSNPPVDFGHQNPSGLTGVSTPTKLTGSFVNYYLVRVEEPQRTEQAPYTAECEDVAGELRLTFNEFCIFKAIWRSAAARLGNGKPDHKALYDAEKILHYAQRNLKEVKKLHENHQ